MDNRAILAAPTDVSILSGAGQNTIHWNSAQGALNNIYKGIETGLTIENGTKIENVTSPYVDDDLPEGIPVFYIVTSFKGGDEAAAAPVQSSAWRPSYFDTLDPVTHQRDIVAHPYRGAWATPETAAPPEGETTMATHPHPTPTPPKPPTPPAPNPAPPNPNPRP